MKTARVLISGFVQNVGFRHFVKSKAAELGLKGWVRNLPAGRQGLPDGRVEALCQGSKEKIEKIIKLCKKGPFLSEIEEVDVHWENVIDKFEDFVIL